MRFETLSNLELHLYKKTEVTKNLILLRMKYLLVFFLFFISCKKTDFGYSLNVGVYGGVGSNSQTLMKVTGQKTIFEFSCAIAQIDENLLLVTHNTFKKVGTFQFQHGAIMKDHDIKNDIKRALFTFEIKDKNVKVHILNLEDSSEIGTYHFEYGVETKVFKCA